MGLKPQDVVRINSRRLPLRVLQSALTAKDVTMAKLKALFGARRRKPRPVASGISKLERRMLKHQARTEKWKALLASAQRKPLVVKAVDRKKGIVTFGRDAA